MNYYVYVSFNEIENIALINGVWKEESFKGRLGVEISKLNHMKTNALALAWWC